MSFALSLVCIRSMNRGNKGYRRFSAIQLNKGGKFLKKLWCCIHGGGGWGREVLQGSLVLSPELAM